MIYILNVFDLIEAEIQYFELCERAQAFDVRNEVVVQI